MSIPSKVLLGKIDLTVPVCSHAMLLLAGNKHFDIEFLRVVNF